MGFLDHSTNNIIIDAVLTDTGRKKLADNNGSFRIAFFSLADDEVDYTVIEKFGRTVGKEKVTKNTPIFEAQTAGDLALKHRLLTLPSPTVIRLPTLSLDGGTLATNNTLAFTKDTTSIDVNVEQKIDADTKVPDGASDVTFTVQVPDRFLRIANSTPFKSEANSRISSYNVRRQGAPTAQNGAKAVIKLEKLSIDDTSFSVFGDGTTITTVVSIVGDQSGLRKEFQVTITK